MPLIISDDMIETLPITVDSQVMSGTRVFEGTRVPIDALTNNLAAGICLDEFLENFPTVNRDQALAVLSFFDQILTRVAGLKS
jgi:uncharacterized protein (DUF433 family)